MARFNHILVPIDFGESSTRALDLGIEMATAFSAALTIAHVWEIPVYPYMVPISVDFLTPVEEAAKAQLAEVVAAARARFPSVDSLLKTGVAWQEIVAAITEFGVDLVVMGTHGRQGLSHMLLGSVAERVVRLSPVPVLTVRAP